MNVAWLRSVLPVDVIEIIVQHLVMKWCIHLQIVRPYKLGSLIFEKVRLNFKPWKLVWLYRFVTYVEGLRFHIWSGTPVNVEANLKKGPTDCPVTSVITYQPAVRNILKELRPQLTNQPTNKPNNQQSNKPTNQQSNKPTNQPTKQQTNQPTKQQTNQPTNKPINQPTNQQTNQPTNKATNQPTNQQTNQPTKKASNQPTNKPTKQQTNQPSNQQSNKPTNKPTNQPTNNQPTNQQRNKQTNKPGVLCKVYIKDCIQSVTPGSHSYRSELSDFTWVLQSSTVEWLERSVSGV